MNRGMWLFANQQTTATSFSEIPHGHISRPGIQFGFNSTKPRGAPESREHKPVMEPSEEAGKKGTFVPGEFEFKSVKMGDCTKTAEQLIV